MLYKQFSHLAVVFIQTDMYRRYREQSDTTSEPEFRLNTVKKMIFLMWEMSELNR